ncbi:MAG: hypothetical protein ACPG4U_08265 [Pseudomonadales bacterium]
MLQRERHQTDEAVGAAPFEPYSELLTLLCKGAVQLQAGTRDRFQLLQLHHLFTAHYACPDLSYKVFRRNLFNSPINQVLGTLGYRIIIVEKHADLDCQHYGFEQL